MAVTREPLHKRVESLREEQFEEAYALLEALAKEVDPEPEEREALREGWAEYQAGKAIPLWKS
mgnify:FL=1